MNNYSIKSHLKKYGYTEGVQYGTQFVYNSDVIIDELGTTNPTKYLNIKGAYISCDKDSLYDEIDTFIKDKLNV